MRIIAIDPSLRSTGIFYVEDGIVNSEVIQRKEKDKNEILGRYALKFAVEAKGFDLLIIEQYAFGMQSRSVTVQAEVGGLIRGLFAARNVPIIEVPIGTWKAVTGISMKKGTPLYTSNYINEVANKFKIRFQTTDEADAFLLYQCVRLCGLKAIPGAGAAHIAQRLFELGIDAKKM